MRPAYSVKKKAERNTEVVWFWTGYTGHCMYVGAGSRRRRQNGDQRQCSRIRGQVRLSSLISHSDVWYTSQKFWTYGMIRILLVASCSWRYCDSSLVMSYPHFISRYADFLLNKSVAKQFLAFQRGFLLVTSESPLNMMFTPSELEMLICGEKERIPNRVFISLSHTHPLYDTLSLTLPFQFLLSLKWLFTVFIGVYIFNL